MQRFSAALALAIGVGAPGCGAYPSNPQSDGTINVYAMTQRSLPGCLAAYPPVGLSAERCVPTGPASEYVATGCANGSYFQAADVDGWRSAYSQGVYVGAIGPVVDGAAEIELIDGARGVCDFLSAELTIVVDE